MKLLPRMKVYFRLRDFPVNVPVMLLTLPADGNEPEYLVGISPAARAIAPNRPAPAATAAALRIIVSLEQRISEKSQPHAPSGREQPVERTHPILAGRCRVGLFWQGALVRNPGEPHDKPLSRKGAGDIPPYSFTGKLSRVPGRNVPGGKGRGREQSHGGRRQQASWHRLLPSRHTHPAKPRAFLLMAAGHARRLTAAPCDGHGMTVAVLTLDGTESAGADGLGRRRTRAVIPAGHRKFATGDTPQRQALPGEGAHDLRDVRRRGKRARIPRRNVRLREGHCCRQQETCGQ